MSARPKIHFITNGIFSTGVAGGDMVFFNLARGAAQNGYEINYFGGHAFQQVVTDHNLPGVVTLTDDAALPKLQPGVSGQVALFRDFYGRYRRTLTLLEKIAPEDFVCAPSDYWFDVIPVVRSRSRRKLMILNMEAPTLGQIIARSRPDIDAMRLGSLHHWTSQKWAMSRFAHCPNRHVLYVHSLMNPMLDQLGIDADHRTLISTGINSSIANSVPEQNKIYDVVWIGRVHRQKGIEDLLATLQFLNQRLKNFRALIVGNVREELQVEIKKRGLESCVEFSGFIKEASEKFRLLKSSRVFLMPSHYESWGIVLAEALVSGVPVVAYDLPPYRPIFGDLVRYAPCFDLEAFQKVAEEQVLQMRAGENYLENMSLTQFERDNSFKSSQEKFLSALEKVRTADEGGNNRITTAAASK
jgi:glycosyltransferase involved in cell wall biosynthesis